MRQAWKAMWIVCWLALPRLESQTLVPVEDLENASRRRLEARGVELGLTYTAEAFTTWKGGLPSSRRGEYLGSLVSTLSVDFARMGVGQGQVFVSAQSLHGRGINDSRVGAVQTISGLDAPRSGRFVEAYYADSYLDGKLRLKAGRQYADGDFGVIENGADFVNSSYGLIPTTPMPTYPEPNLGASLWIAPTPWISWGIGAFKGGSLEPLAEGTQMVRKRSFTMLETKVEPFSRTAGPHGSYHFGIWQQARGAWLAGADAPVRNYGFHAAADHWFLPATAEGENRGPGVFFQWGRTPSDRNEVTGYTGGGVVYQGLVRGRPGDTVGLGITRVGLAGAARGETVFELFYKCQVTPKVMLQPDLQWVRHPSGIGPAALVAGLRMGVEF